MGFKTDAITVTGIEDLIKKFNELPQKVEVKILRKSVNDMGATMLEELKTRAFVAENHIKRGNTRTTKKGVGYSVYFANSLKDSLTLSKAAKKKDSLISQITTPNYYFKFLEYGSYGHPAYHPFIRPAMDSKADPTMKSALDYILGEIQKL